ncbi:MAG: hypothetical protein ACE1Y4_03365 [Lysobacterales bacterium]
MIYSIPYFILRFELLFGEIGGSAFSTNDMGWIFWPGDTFSERYDLAKLFERHCGSVADTATRTGTMFDLGKSGYMPCERIISALKWMQEQEEAA